MSVFAPILTCVWSAVESYGLDPEPLYAKEGLGDFSVVRPHERVPLESLSAIMAGAIRLTGDPAFGLRLGESLHPSYVGPIGFAWLTSKTLREAIGLYDKHGASVLQQSSIKGEDVNGWFVISVTFDYVTINETAREDATLSLMVQLCRASMGMKFSPSLVEINHPEPKDISPYEEFFRCKLRFGSPCTRVFMPVETADRNLPGANPVLTLIHEKLAAEQVAKLKRDDISGRVRALITEMLPLGNVNDRVVANAMHMSTRTMHRRLQRDNTNFRQLLNERRHELASIYIQDRTLSLTQISYLLGFSQLSSFSRAFKHWTGVTPSEMRQG